LLQEQRDNPDVPRADHGSLEQTWASASESVASISRGFGPASLCGTTAKFSQRLPTFATGYRWTVAAAHTVQSIKEVGLRRVIRTVSRGQVKVLEETTWNLVLGDAVGFDFMYMVLGLAVWRAFPIPSSSLTLPLSVPFCALFPVDHRARLEPVERAG